MAYKALYREYRPQAFDEFFGQTHISKTIQNAIKENKISHAYLFSGPRGTGKTTMAKLLAKSINCEEDNRPCNECDDCKAIMNGTHPDVIEIDAASNNGVDEVREIIDKVKYAPIKGKYKVYIIDEVHMMSTGAFNALLKTLEEPPAHVVFILATTEPHKILPTIISRCQRFDFKKVEERDIISVLESVLKQENVSYEPEALNIIAKLADGGFRDSLSILEQCLAYSMNSLTVKDVTDVYSILSMDHKITFLKTLLSKDVKKVLGLLNEMLQSGIDIKRLTFDLIDILKDVIIFKNTNDYEILFVLNETYIKDLAPYITTDECFDLIDILILATEQYRNAVNPNVYFELAALKITNQIKDENKLTSTEIETFTLDDKSEVAFKPTIEDKPLEVSQNVVNEIAEEHVSFNENDIEDVDANVDVVTNEFDKHFITEDEIEQFAPSMLTQVSSSGEEQSDDSQISMFDDLDNYDPAQIENEVTEESEIISSHETFGELTEEMFNEAVNKVDENDTVASVVEVKETKVEVTQEIVGDIQISKEDIMNILVQAERKILNQAIERWSLIRRYLANMNTAKYAAMFVDATPVALANRGMIITYEHQPEANRVNYYENYQELRKFISEVLGDEYDYIALTSSQWTDIRNEYLKLRQVGKLPDSKTIVLSHIVNRKEPEKNAEIFSEAIQYGLDIFGDLVEVLEDE